MPNTPPPSSAARLYHDLVRISRTLRAAAGAGGLTAGSASALWTIVNHCPIRLSDLADRESVAAPTMSRVVAGLENSGYVVRSVDPDDRRARLFEPTAAGIELITTAGSRKAHVLRDAVAKLNPDEQACVRDGLALLAGALLDTAEPTAAEPTAAEPTAAEFKTAERQNAQS